MMNKLKAFVESFKGKKQSFGAQKDILLCIWFWYFEDHFE